MILRGLRETHAFSMARCVLNSSSTLIPTFNLQTGQMSDLLPRKKMRMRQQMLILLQERLTEGFIWDFLRLACSRRAV